MRIPLIHVFDRRLVRMIDLDVPLILLARINVL